MLISAEIYEVYHFPWFTTSYLPHYQWQKSPSLMNHKIPTRATVTNKLISKPIKTRTDSCMHG